MTTSWATGSLVALDTETSGVDVEHDRIVELAAVEVLADGSAGRSLHAIVDPGIEIPEGAAAIHGITTERARSEGAQPAEVLAHLADFLYSMDLRRTPIVMMNARFDWPIVLHEAVRHGIDVPIFAPVLDPMVIDRACDRYRSGSRKLVAIADHYGVELGEAAHGAMADAIAAAGVMRALVERFPHLGEMSLAWLWLQQARWYEDWRSSFVDHRRRTSDPQFQIAPGWPLPVVLGVV